MTYSLTWKMRNLQNIFTSSNRLTKEELSMLNINKCFWIEKCFETPLLLSLGFLKEEIN